MWLEKLHSVFTIANLLAIPYTATEMDLGVPPIESGTATRNGLGC